MAVVRVANPDLLLVGAQADAVARAAVPLCRPALEAMDLDTMNHLAALEVADLEAEQAVDRDKDQRLVRVDGERPNAGAERADGLDDLVRLGVRDRQERRLEA